MLREVCNRPVMCKLDALARELVGVGLLVVWSRGESYSQIPVCGNADELPRFCRMLHEEPEGQQRCVTCHSLLALAASNRGCVTQGCCHGGACVVAAPAVGEGLQHQAEIVVISSCAFALSDRKQGWRSTRKVARNLKINLAELRSAYGELPELRGRKLKLVGAIVDVAAASISEALSGWSTASVVTGEQTGQITAVETKLHAALQSSRETPFRNVAGSPPATVVDVVRAVVGANPQLPVTVADIARAAHMTPNYFSLVFHRETGQTFTTFLLETRLGRAQERLQDLTLSISQVARQAGFADPNYFAKVFRKHTGMAPSQWRTRHGPGTRPKHNRSRDLSRET